MLGAEVEDFGFVGDGAEGDTFLQERGGPVGRGGPVAGSLGFSEGDDNGEQGMAAFA